MNQCGKCIYYKPTENYRTVGTCTAPVPYWAKNDGDNNFVMKNDIIAQMCPLYTEDQEEE